MYTLAMPPAGPRTLRERPGRLPSSPTTSARLLEDGVDERAERRGGRQDDQRSDEQQPHDDRNEEPGAPLDEELEQLPDRPDESQGDAPAPGQAQRGRSIQKPLLGSTANTHEKVMKVMAPPSTAVASATTARASGTEGDLGQAVGVEVGLRHALDVLDGDHRDLLQVRFRALVGPEHLAVR